MKLINSYFALVQQFPLVSIRTATQLDEATSVLRRLLAKGELDEGEEAYLEALGDLIGVFETQQEAIEPVEDAEVLQHLLLARGESQAELAERTGIAKSTISAILSGKRRLTRRHIELLARHFGIGESTFLAAN